jgi:hypothetical protein
MKTRNTSLALLAATTFVVAACSSNDNDRKDPSPPMGNEMPAITTITGKMENQDTVIGPIEFGVQDAETPANMLVVTAAADGTSLFPADGLVLAGNGVTRTLTLTPLEAATGTANITLTVTDAEGAMATRSFSVMVNARNASTRAAILAALAKGENAEPVPLNGFTFADDANDPAFFEALIGNE